MIVSIVSDSFYNPNLKQVHAFRRIVRQTSYHSSFAIFAVGVYMASVVMKPMLHTDGLYEKIFCVIPSFRHSPFSLALSPNGDFRRSHALHTLMTA